MSQNDRRRRKPANQRKEEVVKVLLTAQQKAECQAAADREGQTLSAWIRAVALRAAHSQA